MLGTAPATACIQSARASRTGSATRRRRHAWSAGRAVRQRQGGYVNRFGAERRAVRGRRTRHGAGRQRQPAACATTWLNERRTATLPTQGSLQCNDLCRPDHDSRLQQLTNGQLNQLNNQLAQAQNAANPDAAAIATLEAQIAAVEAEIVGLAGGRGHAARRDCQTQFDALVAAVRRRPANPAAAIRRSGARGRSGEFDGNPVFFPVDSVMGHPRRSVPGEASPTSTATTGGRAKPRSSPARRRTTSTSPARCSTGSATTRTPTPASTSRVTTTSGCSSTAASRSTSAASTCRPRAPSPSTRPQNGLEHGPGRRLVNGEPAAPPINRSHAGSLRSRRGQRLQDHRLPGRAKARRLFVPAHAVRLRSHAQRLHGGLRRRHPELR